MKLIYILSYLVQNQHGDFVTGKNGSCNIEEKENDKRFA